MVALSLFGATLRKKHHNSFILGGGYASILGIFLGYCRYGSGLPAASYRP
jgi:hypothetical protein